MIYITNAKARTNILSITSGCRVYLLFTIHMGVLQRSQDRLVGWEEGGIRAVDSQENH